MEYPLMKQWQAPDGTIYEICDEAARKKDGYIDSPDIDTIRVMDRAEYEALPVPRPVGTVYLIKG